MDGAAVENEKAEVKDVVEIADPGVASPIHPHPTHKLTASAKHRKDAEAAAVAAGSAKTTVARNLGAKIGKKIEKERTEATKACEAKDEGREALLRRRRHVSMSARSS
jgi:hypothetical protein